MPVITLTSDWKNGDYYIGALKGKILAACPAATIVDISHSIQPFSISQAAFVVRNCYRNYPEGTIHIIAVNTEQSGNKPHVVVKSDNQYFISRDNGIFGLLFVDEPLEAIAYPLKSENNTSFSALTVFSHLASGLINGRSMNELGEKHDSLFRQVPMLPTIDESVINGSIVYIDSYSNAITNITEDVFKRVGKGRKFDIFIQSNHYKIDRLNTKYADSSVGELLALFNSAGLLEVAINNGNAAELLNLAVGSAVRVKFN